jgi:hypothetical protein
MILDASPAEGINPIEGWQDNRLGGKAGEYYLIYFGKEAPGEWLLELPATNLPPGTAMRVEVIDAWNMTITPIDRVFQIVSHNDTTVRAEDNAKTTLPAEGFAALRITRVRR